MAKTKYNSRNIISWFNPLFKSRIVLYLLFIASLVNLYVFMTSENGIYAAVFVLVGFLTTFFSKNMIVVMIMSLAVSNILYYARQMVVEEGFESNGESKEGDIVEESPEKEVVEDVKDKKPVIPDTSTVVDKISDKKVEDKGSPKPTSAQIEKAKIDYKELANLHKQLIDQVSGTTQTLEQAKKIVAGLKAVAGPSNQEKIDSPQEE